MPIQDSDFLELLAQTAPGTPLREGLDAISRLGKGALILIADRAEAAPVIYSGFELNTEFTPQKLTELSKMDRAIVVDRSLKQILFANVLLIPDLDIPSQETGTRHLAAEIAARKLSAPTIAVSASKDRVSLYYGDRSHILPDFSTLTARVNQSLHILEQYRSTLDDRIRELNSLEFDDRVLSDDVASVIQLMVQMLQVQVDTERWFIELGEEKYLYEQMSDWLLLDVETRFHLVLRDYQREERDVAARAGEILSLPHEKLLETHEIMRVLGHDEFEEDTETPLSPRGYRVLHEIHRLPSSIAERVVDAFDRLSRIAEATESELIEIKGIGSVRAKVIRGGMLRMKALYIAMP